MNSGKVIVTVDALHTSRPLQAVEAMQSCAVGMELRHVPCDMGGVYLVVFLPNGTHFGALPMTQDDNEDWHCEIPATHFPTVGRGKYEAFAVNGNGSRIALGKGDIVITAFDSGTIPIPSGDVVPVSEIADSNGVMHRIVAVNVGTAAQPDWTTQLAD